MLTWDEEVTSDLLQVVETAHYPNLPFTIVQMTRDEKGEVTDYKSYHCSFSEHVLRMRRFPMNSFEAYMAVCGSASASMRLTDLTESWCLVLDFDKGLHNLCAPGGRLSPTIAVETSSGRFHCAWQLASPITAAFMGRILKVMAARLDADMAMARPNQMARLPRFVNQKYGSPVVLRNDFSSGKIYTAEFLFAACDGILYEASVKQASPELNHTHQAPSPDRLEVSVAHARAAAMHLAGRGNAEYYGTWWPVLANLGPLGPQGLAIAHDFSRASSKYDPAKVEAKWRQLLNENAGTLSTLFSIAQKEGWSNPGWADVEGTEPARGISDREFGGRIALELSQTVVAIDLEGNGRSPSAQFLKWDGYTYHPLSPRDKRAEIGAAGLRVIAKARQKGNGEGGWSFHEKKLGNNKSLDEVAEHVAEALVAVCAARIVSKYPHLPVANGVLNLLTHDLVPQEYQPISQVAAPVRFDAEAQAPLFMQFLDQVLLNDAEMVTYVLRVLGYSLLGNPLEQVMFILLGPSGNGKSTLMAAVLALLGAMVGRLKTETLMQKSHVTDGPNPAQAKLKGARVILVAEPNRNHKLDTSLLKQLTGEKSIYVRGLYSGGAEVPIECVIFMTANFMPFAEAQDAGMWRRIRVIPFDRQFSAEEINPNMTEDLIAESSGILNLLLQGLADYQAQGLNPPPKALTAAAVLKQEADSFGVFVGECCVLQHTHRVALKELWAAYQTWAKANPKFPIMLKREFTQRLEGQFQRKMRGHLPTFVGLSLAGD